MSMYSCIYSYSYESVDRNQTLTGPEIELSKHELKASILDKIKQRKWSELVIKDKFIREIDTPLTNKWNLKAMKIKMWCSWKITDGRRKTQ